MRFFLIDKIVSWHPGQSAEAIKNIALSEDFFRDHFPRRPVMPGMLIIEGMAQLSGVLLEETLKRETGLSVKAVVSIIERTKFRDMVKPGDQLLYRATVQSVNEMGGKARCQAFRGDRKITETALTFGFKKTDDDKLDVIRGELLSLWLRDCEDQK